MSYSCVDFVDDILEMAVQTGLVSEDDLPDDDPKAQAEALMPALWNAVAPLGARMCNLQKRLVDGCALKVEYDPLHAHTREGELWAASIAMERNVYPHWVKYRAQTPEAAVAMVEEYLDGKRRDHANQARAPKLFLADTEERADAN